MSLQSLMVHTAWMGCGSSATPPSLCPNTGATASCLPSSGSPSPSSGASCSPVSPSATSGPWCPASRAVWSSRSASAASTPFASRPSVTLSLKPWARSSAVSVWRCAKKSKNSYSSVDSVMGLSAVSFYTPEDQTWHLARCLVLFLHPSWHAAPHPPSSDMPTVDFANRSCVTAEAGRVVLWQLWHSWRRGLPTKN